MRPIPYYSCPTCSNEYETDDQAMTCCVEWPAPSSWHCPVCDGSYKTLDDAKICVANHEED